MGGYFEVTMFQLAGYLALVLAGLVLLGLIVGVLSLPVFFAFVYGANMPVQLLADRGPHFLKYVLLMFRTLQRNLLRTSLTYLATFVLVFVATAILSVLDFIDQATAEKEGNLKGIITERYHNPSGMPLSLPNEIWNVAKSLPEQDRPKSYRIAEFVKNNNVKSPEQLLALMPPDLKPKDLAEAQAMMETGGEDDIMTWSFVAGNLDPDKATFENMIFFFALEPRKLKTMMPGIEELTAGQLKDLDRAIAAMEANRQGVIVGKARLKAAGKRVGDKITVYCKNFNGITFECQIIGELPEGRWDQAAGMNAEFLAGKLQEYRFQNKKPHENEDKAIALVWVRLPNKEAFQHMAERVNKPGAFTTMVRMETESGAYGNFLDVYRDLLWAARWLLVPAILATTCLVIANAISISVRERRTEMAVLKVLGFSPNMVMIFIVGEALLVGVISSMFSVGIAFVMVNKVLGGIPLMIAFFPKFFIPIKAFGWGLAFGTGASLLGSFLPALSARTVKASDVFSKVA